MWIITKDYICDEAVGGECVGQHSDNFNEEIFKTHKKSEFRLFDDDRNLYLEGLISTDDLNDCEEVVYDVLDTYMHGLGVTIMEYKENGKWKTL